MNLIPPDETFMDITLLPSGSLQLRLDESDEVDEIRHTVEKGGDMAALWDLMEPYWANGRYQPFDAGEGNPFVGLTSAPCIAECMGMDDDGRQTIEGRVWWFPNYMITSVVDELLANGHVDFPAAPALEREATPATSVTDPSARRRRSP
jgi:hypothetical protein